MAGTFIEGVSEVLSGVYTVIKAAITAITKGTRGIVALTFAANWGPTNSLQYIASSSDFYTLYNPVLSTLTAYKAYLHTYKGSPRVVMAYRAAAAAAAKGTVQLNDAGAAKSLELETLYPSDRAFTAVVAAGTSGGKLVKILEGGVLLCQVDGTTVASLETQLNATAYVRVKSKGANMPADNAGANFAGGNNGSTLTSTEYTAFLDAVERDATANTVVLDAVTDEAIHAVAEAWVKRVRSEGFYCVYVRGGLTGWDSDTSLSIAKAVAANYRGEVVLGNGADGYTSAELAYYLAARVASVALNQTLTDETSPYATVNKKLTKGERVALKRGGVVAFQQVGTSVVIDEGVNTLTTPGTGESKEFGKIRVSNALDYIVKDLEAFGVEYKKTRSNTAEARIAYAATVETDYLAPLVKDEILQPGCYYVPNPDYYGDKATKKAAIDEAFFYGDLTPVDSMEKIYQSLGVHF